MTTENYSDQRSIGTLLSLDTYQGMTDIEIDSIIEFKVRTEVMRRLGENDTAMSTILMEQLIAESADSCRIAHDALQSILSRGPVLKDIEVVQ